MNKRPWENLKDEELIDEYAEKKKDEIFKELYNRYNEKIFNYMRKYLYYSPEDIVKELLAEVFIKVYLNISQFPQIKLFKSWIYRIAHNICINHIKKQKNMVMDGDSVLYHTIDKRINIEKEFIDNEIREFIFNEIKNLNDEIREIIVFKFYQNLTYDEISGIMKIPVRIIKYRLKNAIVKLQAKLKKVGLYTMIT